MRRMLLILSVTAGLSILFSACPKPVVKGGGPTDPKDKCGHCQSEATEKVCTEQGTMDNECLAICRQTLIKCRQACPCPPVKDAR